MAGPITWRNVGGGDLGAGQLAASGTQAIQQGLASLQRLAAEQQQLNMRNQKVIRDNNTQDYLDQVSALSTAGDLNNPDTRAQLEAARASYGGLIDRAATRGAIDQRVSELQKQEVQQNQFADMNLEREQRPLVEQLYQFARDGNHDGVNKMLGEVNFLQEGKLASDLDSVFDKQTQREYAAEGQARAARGEARADRSEQRSIAQFNESMSAAAENRAFRREQFNELKEERAFKRGNQLLDSAIADVDQKLKLAESYSPGGKASTDPTKDTSVFMKQLDSTNDVVFGWDSNSKLNTQRNIQTLLTDGIEVQLNPDDETKTRIPITPGQMQQFVDVHKGDTMYWTGGTRDTMNDYFTEMFKNNPELGKRAIESVNAQRELRKVAKTLGDSKRQLLGGRAGNLSGTLNAPDSSDARDLKARQGFNMMPEREEDN